jgi:hypothetical protein
MGLAGCNLVVSEEPWFTAADAAPVPALRDGLWIQAEPGCRVDEARPAERWPECANATFVRGDERWTMRWEPVRRGRRFAGWEPGDAELSDGLLIDNGDHLIVQDPPPAKEIGQVTEEGSREVYAYAAMRPILHDDQGNVTALEIWFVRCGPLPEADERRGRSRRDDDAEQAASYVTDRPFPGLTVVENDCVATSVEALRKAAVLSEALGPPFEMRWLREGWR